MAYYDSYYLEHKRIVVGGVIFCNFLAQMALLTLGYNWSEGLIGIFNIALFYVSLIGLFWVRSKRANVVLLIFNLIQYPALSFYQFLLPDGH